MRSSTLAGMDRRGSSRRVPPVRPGLSSQLREATRAAHVAVEAAFALDARLAAGRDAYGGLLLDLRGFYGPVEAALVAAPGWARLAPRLDVRSRCRVGLIDEDLRRLGLAGAPCARMAGVPALGSLARGLGCLYVLEGSALGGRIVARRAREALGEDLPVAFFSSRGGEQLAADWRALQRSLDAFGARRGAVARRVAVSAARETFGALGGWLTRGPARDRGDG
jgi:heme oxygenase